MSFSIEAKKVTRTGFYPAIILGGIIAAAVPLINIGARPENFVNRDGSTLAVILNANWSMVSMLNVFAVILGACVMWNVEYGERAIEKMRTLPLRMSSIVGLKGILLLTMALVPVILEHLSIVLCGYLWFAPESNFIFDATKNFIFSILMLLPVCGVMTAIASVCRNMWISLGIGVICVFAMTIMGGFDSFAVKIFPFSLPMITFAEAGEAWPSYGTASLLETVIISIAAGIIWKLKVKSE